MTEVAGKLKGVSFRLRLPEGMREWRPAIDPGNEVSFRDARWGYGDPIAGPSVRLTVLSNRSTLVSECEQITRSRNGVIDRRESSPHGFLVSWHDSPGVIWVTAVRKVGKSEIFVDASYGNSNPISDLPKARAWLEALCRSVSGEERE